MNILDKILEAEKQAAQNQETRNVMELPVLVPPKLYKAWIDSWKDADE